MHKFSIFAASTLAVAVPAMAQTQAPQTATPQTQAAPPAAANPVADDLPTMNRAALIFGLFSEAIRTEEIPEAEKNAVLGCLYENDLKTISEETGRVLAENADIDAAKPQNVYLVAATICGARSAQRPAADAPASAPPTDPAAPESR